MNTCSGRGMGLILSIILANIVSARDEYPRHELLVEPSTLAKAGVPSAMIILDARRRQSFMAGRIPSARWVDHDDWQKSFDNGKDAASWGQRIRALGISSHSIVAIYDDSMNKDSARIWWILRFWGVENARIINGGWKGWQLLGQPSESTPPAAFAESAFTPTPVAARLATKAHMLRILDDGEAQIVDARSEAEHCGAEKLRNKRAGAMPGARLLEWSTLVDKETHRFKSASEIRRLLADAGIDVSRPVAAHCQSGGRSSVTAFVLELMGATDVRNYYKSWSEWGNADDTPIVITKPLPLPVQRR